LLNFTYIDGGTLKFANHRLQLREFCPTDLDSLVAYAIQSEMRRYEKGLPDRESAHIFLEQSIQKASASPRQHYCLAITLASENKIIGHVSLTSQNPDICEWEIGWAVQFSDWGKGYATEAAYLMLGFAFGQLKAHRVVAFSHTENSASVKVMEKIGMKQEGHLRQTRWFNGRWADEYVYGILESDFKNDYHDV
jgi:RimJ/RimL family protein N-acetyltransferase